jgi:hypothetical protein
MDRDDAVYPECDVMRLVLAVSLLLGLLAVAVAVPARAASGIHPISPAAGDSVPRGEAPTFRMRVNGRGAVFVRVCRTSRKRGGAICANEAAGQARRGADRTYTFKPKLYRFADYFANRAGTYYWQAVRVACQGTDCRQEGPVVRFEVR